MKYNIIQTEKYLLVVDDSDIKEGDYTYHHIKGIYTAVVDGGYTNQKKIIAHLPLNNSPILEGVDLLPSIEQEDNVEKLGIERAIERRWNPNSLETRRVANEIMTAVSYGYNKAKEKYKYTEEDIQKAFTYCAKYAAECVSSGVRVDFLSRLEMYLESLSQPKIPVAFEFEWRPIIPYEYTNEEHLKVEPKTTTNSQGQTILVGKYIY